MIDLRRSKLCDYVGGANGGYFWDWINDARPIRYALARCDDNLHDAAEADSDITPLSPRFDDDLVLNVWGEDTNIAQVIKDRLEADGCNTAWIAAAHKRRHAIQYLSKLHVVMQRFKGAKDGDALEFFKRALNLTVADVPVNVRQRISTWMTNHGMDTSWIGGATEVRAVVHAILLNLTWRSRAWPIMRLGAFRCDID